MSGSIDPEAVLPSFRRDFPLAEGPVAAAARSLDTGGGVAAAAFSGGADSLFLLLWLKAWFPSLAQRTLVLHFDHGTRDGGSAADARVAEGRASALGFRFLGGGGRVAGDTSEDGLRSQRFGFLVGAMAAEGIRSLFLGHQADDVAETLLARAATGSGPEGLSAPRPVSRHGGEWPHERLRPLLEISAERIRTFLEGVGFAVIEDPSNTSGAYLRNRLRASVVPAWKDAFPGRDLLNGVGRSRRLLEETSDFVEVSARRILPGGWEREQLPLARLSHAHRACVRFVVQRWIAFLGVSMSPSAVEELLCSIGGEGRCGAGRWSVGSAGWLVMEGGWLRYERKMSPPEWGGVAWTVGSWLFLPDGARLEARYRASGHELRDRILRGAVDPAREAFLSVGERDQLSVRRRRPGDRLRPLGAPGSRKLKDCLTDRKIPLSRRDYLPVVEVEGRIAWVPGLPPAEEFRVGGDEEILMGLTYRSE